MAQQERKKGLFGAISNLFKSKDSDCCSIGFEEIEEEKEADREGKLKDKTDEVQTSDRQGGCCD